MTAGFRCSAASLDLDEELAGSASTVRAFLLVEAPGPWGVDVLRDSRLPEPVRRWLAGLETEHRVRPLLVRRHGRGVVTSPTVFAASVRPEGAWVQTARLDDVHDVVDLDVGGLAHGASPGLEPFEGPLFLVCTHGRHDVCCAEAGRPVAAALARIQPDRTWEVSHVGGDRFAANVLVLPHGLYYGRVTPGDAEELARAHHAGTLDLDHLRGRSCYSFAVQAAEIHLRRHLGAVAVEPLTIEDHRRDGASTRLVFAVGTDRWAVTVRTRRAEPRRLTCGSPSAARALEHSVTELVRL